MTTIVTKGEIMAAVIAGEHRECFEHETEGLFDVTEMRRLLQAGQLAGELHAVELELIIPHILGNRVVDQQRVQELDRKSWRDDPGIMVITREDIDGTGPTVLMIDGHHRALRRYQEGFPTIRMWFIKAEDAVRPASGWVKNPYVDWGDEIVDGKIIPR